MGGSLTDITSSTKIDSSGWKIIKTSKYFKACIALHYTSFMKNKCKKMNFVSYKGQNNPIIFCQFFGILSYKGLPQRKVIIPVKNHYRLNEALGNRVNSTFFTFTQEIFYQYTLMNCNLHYLDKLYYGGDFIVLTLTPEQKTGYYIKSLQVVQLVYDAQGRFVKQYDITGDCQMISSKPDEYIQKCVIIAVENRTIIKQISSFTPRILNTTYNSTKANPSTKKKLTAIADIGIVKTRPNDTKTDEEPELLPGDTKITDQEQPNDPKKPINTENTIVKNEPKNTKKSNDMDETTRESGDVKLPGKMDHEAEIFQMKTLLKNILKKLQEPPKDLPKSNDSKLTPLIEKILKKVNETEPEDPKKDLLLEDIHKKVNDIDKKLPEVLAALDSKYNQTIKPDPLPFPDHDRASNNTTFYFIIAFLTIAYIGTVLIGFYKFYQKNQTSLITNGSNTEKIKIKHTSLPINGTNTENIKIKTNNYLN